eukprot:TRINITY_DN464_c0_g3_i2.p1 TRINITY_DN464_c0_g3~~TRINITY_DN464_c0_g3_i2.p1  ORF type:complete len:247 (+),score=43.52 TRINITY_DN464_c0_g3_i2:54-794(+)
MKKFLLALLLATVVLGALAKRNRLRGEARDGNSEGEAAGTSEKENWISSDQIADHATSKNSNERTEVDVHHVREHSKPSRKKALRRGGKAKAHRKGVIHIVYSNENGATVCSTHNCPTAHGGCWQHRHEVVNQQVCSRGWEHASTRVPGEEPPEKVVHHVHLTIHHTNEDAHTWNTVEHHIRDNEVREQHRSQGCQSCGGVEPWRPPRRHCSEHHVHHEVVVRHRRRHGKRRCQTDEDDEIESILD